MIIAKVTQRKGNNPMGSVPDRSRYVIAKDYADAQAWAEDNLPLGPGGDIVNVSRGEEIGVTDEIIDAIIDEPEETGIPVYHIPYRVCKGIGMFIIYAYPSKNPEFACCGAYEEAASHFATTLTVGYEIPDHACVIPLTEATGAIKKAVSVVCASLGGHAPFNGEYGQTRERLCQLVEKAMRGYLTMATNFAGRNIASIFDTTFRSYGGSGSDAIEGAKYIKQELRGESEVTILTLAKIVDDALTVKYHMHKTPTHADKVTSFVSDYITLLLEEEGKYRNVEGLTI